MHDISMLRKTHIDAISAMESMQKNIPTATTRNIQTPPAIPPLARVTFEELLSFGQFPWSVQYLAITNIRATTQALPNNRLKPQMETKRKLRWFSVSMVQYMVFQEFNTDSELLKLSHTTHVIIIVLGAALGCLDSCCTFGILDLVLERTGGLDRRRVLDTIHLNGGGGHVGGEERFARAVGQRKRSIGQTSGWSYTPSLYSEEDRTHARINKSTRSERRFLTVCVWAATVKGRS